MDSKPFLEFTLDDFDDSLANEIKKFSKGTFEIGAILATATELKYTREIRRVLLEEYLAPSDELVRFFGKQVYSGSLTQGRLQQFRDLTRTALQQFVSEKINDRLKTALASESTAPVIPPVQLVPEGVAAEVAPAGDIVTTDEEREAYFIVKAILRDAVDVHRIAMRDQKTYCSVLLDDNNRKPICRFYFNGGKRQIGIIADAEKHEERFTIETVDDIYQHGPELRKSIGLYEGSTADSKS